jgi:2-methylcitrate dehydratase PrpD
MQISIPDVEPVMHLPPVPGWLSRWAEFAATVRFSDLDATVVSRSKQVLYDCIAAIAAGAQEPEIGRLTERLLALGGTGGALTPAIGGRRRLPAPMAVLVNGTAGTMLELDEGNQYCRGHPGIHLVPAALAAAERRGKSGRDLLLAIALGYEVGARVGIASKLRVTMHPHGTWGTVGAALAVAKLHGSDAGRMRETINVASTLGLGTSRRTMLEGGTVRNSFAGWSNQLGLIAWEMVGAGFTGEVDGIGTVYGTVLAEAFQPEAMVAGLGTRWEIARNYFKRHACCRYNHGALDALGRIMAEAGGRLDPDAIARIDVSTYVWAAQLAGQEPHNMLAAKFSLPFSVATFVVNGAATVEAFRDKARDDATTRDLARRVFVAEDKALTARLPGLRPARVTVRLTDGRVLSAESLTNRGDTEDPYPEAEIRAKFIELTTPVWGRMRAEAVLKACATIDDAETVGDLMEMLAG